MNMFIDTEDMEERYREQLYQDYLVEQNKDLQQEIQQLKDKLNKATNYYYKTLAEYEKENKQMPEESVMMFNLMEGNK